MKKQDMQKEIDKIFYNIKKLEENGKGATKEEMHELYLQIYYFEQQTNF